MFASERCIAIPLYVATMKGNTMSSKRTTEARPSQKKNKLLVLLNTCLKVVRVVVLLLHAVQKLYEVGSKLLKFFE